MSKKTSNQILTRHHQIKFDKNIRKGKSIVGGYYLSVNTRLRPLSSWKNNENTIHSSRVYSESYETFLYLRKCQSLSKSC